MPIKSDLEYVRNGLEEYEKFRTDSISEEVEVYQILPDGAETLDLIPKSQLRLLFANLNRISSLPALERPLILIGGENYRMNRFEGLATNISNDYDYIVIYLEDLTGKSYEFMYFPQF